ncbi:hypothetical protein [Streptomyces sp. NPDC059008]
MTHRGHGPGVPYPAVLRHTRRTRLAQRTRRTRRSACGPGE